MARPLFVSVRSLLARAGVDSGAHDHEDASVIVDVTATAKDFWTRAQLP
jgi:hypothetical protein